MAAPEKPASRPLASADDGASVSDDLDELVRLHSQYVAGLAYRLLGRDSDVDDIVQEVFVALLRFHGSVRNPQALRGWLATTTVRLAQRRMRTRSLSVRRWLGLEAPETALAPATGASPEEHVALTRVHLALQGVSPSARVAWILRYVEQERMEDVARLIGCSLTTTKRRVEAAQHAVKRALGDD
ncbi:MAG: RNA polymerase sigma factor [Polyangiaceae bacterium]